MKDSNYLLHKQNLLIWEENEADALLHMLVDHWVTIRGYSFASSYVERYKQKQKKTVQKSKGLRNNFLNSKCCLFVFVLNEKFIIIDSIQTSQIGCNTIQTYTS